MLKGFDNFKYLLVATCDITNILVVILIKTEAVQVVAGARIHRIHTFWSTKVISGRQRFSFTGKVSQFILRAINCQLKIISIFIHISVGTERQIQKNAK